MATGTSLFLIALGAILTFAVEVSVAGLDIAVVGVILMIAGIVGLIVSMFFMERLTARRPDTIDRRTVDRPAERRVVEEHIPG